jgi:DNA-binding NtrC family response regulator
MLSAIPRKSWSSEDLPGEQRRPGDVPERSIPLSERVAELVTRLETKDDLHAVGGSKKWREVLEQATRVAATPTTVLLCGESGTGKEIVARLVHRGSRRSNGPFVALNCAALPETLLESELFGHERGAFTGAWSTRAGRIEQAAGGTLFLDEVGEMSPAVQAKLLRVLEMREFQRLGAARSQKADVRVIAATNRDLQDAMARGLFREDLYYRLAVFEISIAPLRERREDISSLAEHFIEEIGSGVGDGAPGGMTPAAREKLQAYSWPGNVRELRNMIERALILCDGGPIDVEHLPAMPDRAPSASRSADSLRDRTPATVSDLQAIERRTIEKTLEKTGQNKSKAARLLGVSRKNLCTRIQRLGLESPIELFA